MSGDSSPSAGTIVEDPNDPRLSDFVALNDPTKRRSIERSGNYFVVEGILAIERLLASPQWAIREVVLQPSKRDRLAASLMEAGVSPTIASAEALRSVVGFDLHRGALASVARRTLPAGIDLIRPGTAGVFLAAEGVNDHENLGALYRNAAAFGVDGVLLDPTCADPFYRRSVRVSLGHVLTTPTGSIAALPDVLESFHQQGAVSVALTPGADLDLAEVDLGARPPHGPLVVVVGAEGPGLEAATIAAATHQARIPMATGVDSLNVATAAAIACYSLSSRWR